MRQQKSAHKWYKKTVFKINGNMVINDIMVISTNIIINGIMVLNGTMVINGTIFLYDRWYRHIIICCVIFFGDMVALGGGGENQNYFGVYSRLYIYISIFPIHYKIKKK